MRKITFWMLALFGCLQMQAQLFTIGTCSATSGSSTYGPMYSVASANAASRTAVVYPASQLTNLTGKNLNAAYFNRSSPNGNMAGTPNFKIYLKEVTITDFGSADVDWNTAITNAVLVYDSNPATSVGTTSGWKLFPFTTNFMYSGTQNLAVFFEYTNSNASSSLLWLYEFGSPCVVTSIANATKYTNTTTGILPTALTAKSHVRPLIGFNYVVSCPAPTALTATNITSNSATFNWTPGGTEMQWEYAVVPAGSGIPTATTVVTNAGLANFPLNPSTAYEIYVRSVCSTDDKSIWVKSASFTTQCPETTSLFENFDSYATTSAPLPNCWNKLGTGSAYVTTGGIIPGSTPNRFLMSTTATTYIHAILPPFSNLTSNTHRLKFKAYASSTNKTLEVGYLTDLLEPSSFVLIQSISLPSPLADLAEEFIVVAPSGIPANVKNLVFKSANGSTTSLYIDDVIWEPVPTCLDVTSFEYSTVTATSVIIDWTAGGTEQAWQYAYGPSQLLNPSTLTPIDVTTSTATITNLTPFTSYKIWVRSNCSAGDLGAWIGPLSFQTQCAATTDFYENFDSSLTGNAADFTNCWQKAGNGTVYITNGSTTPETAPNRLYMSANGAIATPTVALAILPNVSNLQAATHRLKFKAYSLTTNKSIEVGYLEALNDLSSFNLIQEYNLPSTIAASTEDFMAYPSNIPPGVTNLVFRNSAYAGATTVYIDDVVWEQIPACSDITIINLTDFKSTSVTLEWESGGSESNWEYVYAETSVTDPTTLINNITTVNNAPTALISGLLPSTSYNVWIRSKCGTDSYGNWPLNPKVVTTSCAPVATFNENFDSSPTGTTSQMPTCWTKFGNTGNTYVNTGSTLPNSAPNRLYMYASAATPTTSIVVLPPVSNLQANSHRLRFRAYASSANRELEVGYYQKAGMADSFILLESYTLPSTTQVTAAEFIHAPQFLPPGIESLVFRNNPIPFSGTAAIYIDDVVWEPIPGCLDIIEAEITALSTSAVDITWTEGGSETAWQYVYAVNTVTNPNTLTPIDVTNNAFASLTNLNIDTNYNFWVRSNCGSSGFGNWSAPFTFKTGCESVNTFFENFDSYTSGSDSSLPACWQKAGNGSVYIINSGASPASPPNRLYLLANGANETKALAITPAVTNLQAETHQLKFKAYASRSDLSLELGYFSSGDEESSFVMISSFQLPGTTPSSAATFSYTPMNIPVGITRLVFRNLGYNGGPTGMYIDDVSWEPIPNCPDINPATYSNITDTTANISWNSVTSGTTWEYVYALTTVTDPSTLTPVTVTGTPTATIANLTPTTTYKVWVRSVCGVENGIWSTPTTFTTGCALSTLPFMEDFSTFLPSCWSTSSSGTIATGPTATSGGFWIADGFLNEGTTGSARINIFANNRVSWLITPAFDVAAPGQYTFSFDYGITAFTNTASVNMGFDDIILVAFSQDGGASWLEIQLFDASIPISNSSQTFTYTFPSTSAPVKFAIIANDGVVNDPENYNFYVDNLKVESTLGNESFDRNSLTIYPNPVKDVLNVSFAENISDITLYNVLGQHVLFMNMNTNQGQVDMSNLPSGTYLVKATTENGMKTIKVIKE